MNFYHVDRNGTLAANQTIELIKPNIEPPDMMKTLNELYPNGLSYHGLRYAITSYKGLHTDTSTEQIFELYRQMYFPYMPSRFQSFFCFNNLQDALNFSKLSPKSIIYKAEIEHNNYHIGDMNLLKGETILQCHKNALDYWNGKLNTNSIIEVLIVPPIHISGPLILS